jgi:predicted transcriptional regulator
VKRRAPGVPQSGRGVERLLGELEQEIMEILWEWTEASVREVLEQLNGRRSRKRQLAYTTVMTVMSRLADKGILHRELVGRAHTYIVVRTREAFLAEASDEFARQLVEDFGEAAIVSFVNVLEGFAPERLAKLRRRARSHVESG